MVEAVDYVAKQLFTTISSYQEGASGIQTAFNIQNAAMESQIKILDRLNSGAMVAAETLAMIPNPYARAAAGLAGLVAGVTGVGKSMVELDRQGLQAIQKEIAVSAMSFDTMNKNGALFAQGITGMRKTSGELQLNLAEFSKTVNDNKKELIDFGGSVIGGVKRVKDIGAAFTQLKNQGLGDFRKELEYAGYSAQEQTDGMIQFMDAMNKTGKLRSMSDRDIVVQGTEYLKNLRAISAFTGEDAKSAQKRAEQAAEQGAVRVKLEKMGGEATQKFVALSAKIGPDMTKAIQQMMVTGGSVVDKNLNIMLAQSPTRKKILDQVYADLNAGTIGATEASKRYEALVKDNADALKAEGDSMAETFGGLTVLDKGFEAQTKMAQDQQDLALRGSAAKEAEIKGIGDTTTQLSRLITEGVDPFKTSIIDAERVNRERLAKLIPELTAISTVYLKTLDPAKMMAAQEQQLKEAMTGVLPKVGSTDFLSPGKEASKMLTGTFDTFVSGLTGAGNLFMKGAGTITGAFEDFKKYLGKLPGFPSRDTGTLGMTGSLFEKQDFFGKVAKGETVFTPDQLENLVKGVNVSGFTSGMKSASEQNTDTMSAMMDKMNTKPVAPEVQVVSAPQTENLQAVGTQLKDSFAQSMAALQQQRIQPETPKTTDSEDLNKVLETLNNSMSGLTTQITDGNRANQEHLKNLLQALNDKSILEDLLSAMQDNVDYSKRIADNIA